MGTEISFAASGIVVGDLVAAQRFYEDALGMKEVNRARVDMLGLDEVVLAAQGGGYLILMRYDDGRSHVEVGQKLVFVVADPSVVTDGAAAAGGTVTVPPTLMPEYGATIAFVQDPDGHAIELIDRPI